MKRYIKPNIVFVATTTCDMIAYTAPYGGEGGGGGDAALRLDEEFNVQESDNADAWKDKVENQSLW